VFKKAMIAFGIENDMVEEFDAEEFASDPQSSASPPHGAPRSTGDFLYRQS
jgi:hypothetical protein